MVKLCWIFFPSPSIYICNVCVCESMYICVYLSIYSKLKKIKIDIFFFYFYLKQTIFGLCDYIHLGPDL